MTAFERAEEIAAQINHIHRGPNDPCVIRDMIMWAIHEEKAEISRKLESAQRLSAERDELITLKNAEIERLNFLHKRDHSLADQWRDKNAVLELQVGELRDALAWVKRNHNGYPEGHSTCGVCSRIDKALDGKVCPACSDRKTIDIGAPHGVVPCALCGITEKRVEECGSGGCKLPRGHGDHVAAKRVESRSPYTPNTDYPVKPTQEPAKSICGWCGHVSDDANDVIFRSGYGQQVCDDCVRDKEA